VFKVVQWSILYVGINKDFCNVLVKNCNSHGLIFIKYLSLDQILNFVPVNTSRECFYIHAKNLKIAKPVAKIHYCHVPL